MVAGLPIQGIASHRANSSLRFYDADESHYFGLKAPANITSSLEYVLPASPPSSNGKVLAANTDGSLLWSDGSSGGFSHPYIHEEAVVTAGNSTVILFDIEVPSGAYMLSVMDVMGIAAADGQRGIYASKFHINTHPTANPRHSDGFETISASQFLNYPVWAYVEPNENHLIIKGHNGHGVAIKWAAKIKCIATEPF